MSKCEEPIARAKIICLTPSPSPIIHGSKRYKAVRDDTAGLCEHSGGGGEGRHRKQCRRSPQTTERGRYVAKAQRTASSSIRSQRQGPHPGVCVTRFVRSPLVGTACIWCLCSETTPGEAVFAICGNVIKWLSLTLHYSFVAPFNSSGVGTCAISVSRRRLFSCSSCFSLTGLRLSHGSLRFEETRKQNVIRSDGGSRRGDDENWGVVSLSKCA